jgi:hypothetical protein
MKAAFPVLLALSAVVLHALPLSGAPPDLVVHGGKIITADREFTIHEAMAVQGGRIVGLGSNREILAEFAGAAQVVDLEGGTVLPGLIDSHVHPTGASMTEFDHPIPPMESIADVLAYIRGRAEAQPEETWIVLEQVFITRLDEQRYPTRAELDTAAPRHAVVYRTGPDASVNSLALAKSGISKDFQITDGGTGFIEKDPATGEPTGILRSCTRLLKSEPFRKEAAHRDRRERLASLLADYQSVGLTGIIDRDASPAAIRLYEELHADGALGLRVAISHHVDSSGSIEEIRKKMGEVGEHPLCRGGPDLRIVGVKTYLDGGMLTGSAAMREPWGTSRIYGITDPSYRGLLFIDEEKLAAMIEAAVDARLQFTAHSVGDRAVETLLAAYARVAQSRPLAETRPCITHSNFMSARAVEQCAELGVAVDIQPIWLYLDTRTLEAQFGYDRLRYFQPLASLFKAGVVAGGGSDHMQKVGSFRAVNPYNPFLGIQTAVTRRAKGFEGRLHPEEALTREQAIRFYTINNARMMFLEDHVGSLEPGKLADFIVLDRDLLTCPEDEIRNTKLLSTWVGGRQVYPNLSN